MPKTPLSTSRLSLGTLLIIKNSKLFTHDLDSVLLRQTVSWEFTPVKVKLFVPKPKTTSVLVPLLNY